MSDSAAWVAWTEGERSALQVQISGSVLRSISPQVVVFDCLPSPAFAGAVVESEIPIVLCLREMRDLASYVAHVGGLLEHVKLIDLPRLVDSDPNTLVFTASQKSSPAPPNGRHTTPPTKPASNEDFKIFLRMKITAPGKTEALRLPKFPVRAPVP
jgi:hypothetical protein